MIRNNSPTVSRDNSESNVVIDTGRIYWNLQQLLYHNRPKDPLLLESIGRSPGCTFIRTSSACAKMTQFVKLSSKASL